MDVFGDSDDELIGDVVDLIEYEPQRGGFLGLNQKEWAHYQSQLALAIATLESQR